MPQTEDVTIIGAGIIGVCTALALQERGLTVTIVDRTGIAAETSRGNAGAFAFPEVIPLATPGIMRKAPKWLLDPLGPLSIPPRYALSISPWMMRFWRASWRDRVEASIKAQAALMEISSQHLLPLLERVDARHMLREEGQLALYDTVADHDAAKPQWEARTAYGIQFRHLGSADEIAEIQPGLSPHFKAGTFTPQWSNVSDPETYTHHLATYFLNHGGKFVQAEILDISPEENGAKLTTATGAELHAAQVVVAAGAWSKTLARKFGDAVPLETERGYNTTLPDGAFDLRTHLTFVQHGFVVSKIGDGVRVGGAVELGGLKIPPNYKRARTLLHKAKSFLPELRTEGGTEWMGYRPSLPDSLPVIGRAPKAPQVIYAFGHGHLGLTQSSGTAQLVADLVTRNPAQIDLAPYRPDRF